MGAPWALALHPSTAEAEEGMSSATGDRAFGSRRNGRSTVVVWEEDHNSSMVLSGPEGGRSPG